MRITFKPSSAPIARLFLSLTLQFRFYFTYIFIETVRYHKNTHIHKISEWHKNKADYLGFYPVQSAFCCISLDVCIVCVCMHSLFLGLFLQVKVHVPQMQSRGYALQLFETIEPSNHSVQVYSFVHILESVHRSTHSTICSVSHIQLNTRRSHVTFSNVTKRRFYSIRCINRWTKFATFAQLQI